MPLADAFRQNFGAEEIILQLVEDGVLIDTQAKCGDYQWDLAQDPLVQTAIASGKSQIGLDSAQIAEDQEFKTNLAIAITFRERVLGILSLRWKHANAVSNDDIAAIQQCADEVAIALTCIRHYSP